MCYSETTDTFLNLCFVQVDFSVSLLLQHCAHAPVRFRHTNGLVRVRKRCLPSNILVTANRAGEVLTTNVVKHLNAASDLPSLSSITPSQPLSIKINVGN